jgi:hypothetical protein
VTLPFGFYHIPAACYSAPCSAELILYCSVAPQVLSDNTNLDATSLSTTTTIHRLQAKPGSTFYNNVRRGFKTSCKLQPVLYLIGENKQKTTNFFASSTLQCIFCHFSSLQSFTSHRHTEWGRKVQPGVTFYGLSKPYTLLSTVELCTLVEFIIHVANGPNKSKEDVKR